MKEIERIHEAIDNPGQQLLLLADLCEEAGKDVLAEGYRLLHKHGRWPKKQKDSFLWLPSPRQWKRTAPERLPAHAPLARWTFGKASEALHAAALAMGWRRRGLEIKVPDPHLEGPWKVMLGERVLGTVEEHAQRSAWKAIPAGEPAAYSGSFAGAREWIVGEALRARPLPESSAGGV